MGQFEEEQAELARRVARDELKCVFIDPDGTLPDWLFVVVRGNTGVVYGTQCAGVACEQRLVEGYLVPLGGARFDDAGESIELDSFRDAFHNEEGYCRYAWTGAALPAERMAQLARLVETVPYWRCDRSGSGSKSALALDAARVEEMAEAWIPVETPDGAGVLLYKNCD